MTGYTSTIPATNNDPADDQPLMLANFGAISTWVNVDHVGFNDPNFGEHNKVTFNDNNVPVPPVVPPVLFTNDVASLPQLFFYSGDSAHSSNQYTSTTLTPTTSSGSTFALGGIIIKWGKFTAVAGSTTALTYAGADVPLSNFPNATLVVIPTVSNQNLTAGILDGSLSTSGFTVLKSNSAAATIFFIAIGY